MTLLPSDSLITQKVDVSHAEDAGQRTPAAVTSPAAPGDNWVTLHLLDIGQALPLTDRNEFTIGRVAEGQAVMPDIDLAPYQAYSHGVSRLHAVITRGVDDVYLMDLDSANGTYVNGSRLEPNEECTLSNGDVVALGGLKIQILLKTP
ncbi:MAG: FHA domain-containing protein [Chloroflexota bacterium]